MKVLIFIHHEWSMVITCFISAHRTLLKLSLQVDEKQKTVLLSEQGYEDAEEILAVKDLYDPREQWASYILNAIKAKELFLRDVNYIIRGKEILIVDEFTGRVMQVFRYST